MKKSMTLIVPCYNEEDSLPIFYEAVCDVARTLEHCDVTLLLINDGSKDRTLSIMRELAAKDSRVIVCAEEPGVVAYVDACTVLTTADGKLPSGV